MVDDSSSQLLKQMYVIIASGGSHDDAWSRAEFITDDPNKGEEYVNKMGEVRDAVIAARVQIDQWNDHYCFVTNKKPTYNPNYERLESPRWDGDTVVTNEMRDARRVIEDENNRRQTEALKPYSDWAVQYRIDQESYVKSTFSQEIIDGINNMSYDTYWEIEPINRL